MQILSRKFNINYIYFKRKLASNDKKSLEETSLTTLGDPETPTTVEESKLFNFFFQKPVAPRLEVLFKPRFSKSQREQTIGVSDPSILHSLDAANFTPISSDSIVSDKRSIKSIASEVSGRRVGVYIPSQIPDRDEPLDENSEDSLIISQVRSLQFFTLIIYRTTPFELWNLIQKDGLP
jgi:hypothetical protein